MSLPFAPGDDLLFQLESGYGLLRVLAVEQHEGETIWHLLAYEELFPDPESAEAALADAARLHVRAAHLPLTEHAFEKTPPRASATAPSRQMNWPLIGWLARGDDRVFDRSALLLLGLR